MFRRPNQRRGIAQRRPKVVSASQRPAYRASTRSEKRQETPIAALAFVRHSAADPKRAN